MGLDMQAYIALLIRHMKQVPGTNMTPHKHGNRKTPGTSEHDDIKKGQRTQILRRKNSL